MAITTLGTLYNELTNAIRTMEGTTGTIPVVDIPNRIRALKGIEPVAVTYEVYTDFLTDVANALREALGTTDPIAVEDFKVSIEAIVL